MTILQNFEWDERKRDANVKKHNFDFVDAITVFDDQDRLDRIDIRKQYTEIRYQTIGKPPHTDWVVMVIWTHRGKNKRIISARIAHAKERVLYNEKQN